MESGVIKSLLESVFVDAIIDVAIEGSHVKVDIESNEFEGLNTLKRQQKVYAVLSAHIASGEIHAVNMTTKTTAENNS